MSRNGFRRVGPGVGEFGRGSRDRRQRVCPVVPADSERAPDAGGGDVAMIADGACRHSAFGRSHRGAPCTDEVPDEFEVARRDSGTPSGTNGASECRGRVESAIGCGALGERITWHREFLFGLAASVAPEADPQTVGNERRGNGAAASLQIETADGEPCCAHRDVDRVGRTISRRPATCSADDSREDSLEHDPAGQIVEWGEADELSEDLFVGGLPGRGRLSQCNQVVEAADRSGECKPTLVGPRPDRSPRCRATIEAHPFTVEFVEQRSRSAMRRPEAGAVGVRR